jgi:ABC-type polysaccharide/polyol phosphate transport system ATPase subunit
MTLPYISLNNINIAFPGCEENALSEVSLHIESGDLVGVIGNNGSGKSTLLRTLAGIYTPISGSVEIRGKVSSLFNIGLGLHVEYTGLINIRLLMLIYGVSDKDKAQVEQDIIDFTQLGEFLYKPVRMYSSGMAMRLKFACATAIQPDILLLDEWIGAGDFEFQKLATRRMRGLVDDASIMVLATHNIPLMKKMCTKAIWIHRGIIRAYGNIDDVLLIRSELKE